MLEKVVFGDIKTSSLGQGDRIVKLSGTLEAQLQPFIILEFGKQCFK